MVMKNVRKHKKPSFVKKRQHVKKFGEEIIENNELETVDNDPEAVQPKWFNQLSGDKYDDQKVSEEQLVSLRIEAQQVLDEETKTYNYKKDKVKNGSNAAWINTVLKKGTSKDKVAANVVTIQNSPVHSLSNLVTLVNSVNPAKKKECTLVMETLAELFIEDLLRPERKLRPFDKQPLIILNELSGGCSKGRRLRLSLWLFEDRLKDLYEQFVNAVNNVAKDTVEINRIKAVSVMYRLLSSHPEQEQVLLKNLVNKIGDPQQKVVSKVIYCLTQLLKLHPNMKQIIMNEVEKLLFRTNMNSRTQYYSICFLSQFIFESEDTNIARNMIQIYFSFFKALIKKGEIDSRLMGALLMGVKRAHPYAKLDSTAITDHIDTLYKLVHLTPFNIALHALALLQVISNETNDRFYSALYKKLLDPNLNSSCHHAMFINLMYKALSRDTNMSRVKGFIKRLFQISLYAPVPLVCGILYMISQLISRRKFSLTALIAEPQSDAFASFTQNKDEGDDDDEEKYIDVDKLEEDQEIDKAEEEKEDVEEKKPGPHGWVHSEMTRRTSTARTSLYDPLTRNPTYCNADKTAYTELLYLTKHFHPTVALFSNKILKQEVITYTGDPLVDFTLAKFLERFVFKNPKIKDSEDKGPDPQLAQRKYYKPTGIRALQVTSSSYLASDVKDIPVEELFLYRYLKEKYKYRRPEVNDEDDDNASVNSEEFLDAMDKMYGGKKQRDIDFMDEIGSSLKHKTNIRGKKNTEEVDDDETDEEEEEVEEEEEDDEGETEDELSEMEGEDNDEAIDFGEEVGDFDGELDFDEALGSKSQKLKKEISSKKGKTKKSNKDDIQNLLAPAEEFAEILEEAGSSRHKPGMAGTFATMDNAAAKQLDWETKRDRWVNDRNNRKRKWKGGKKQNNNNNNNYNKSMKKRKR